MSGEPPIRLSGLCHAYTYRAPLTNEQIEAIEADDENPMHWCCAGAAMRGVHACTCWEPEYSTRRRKPIEGIEAKPRPSPCDDCAYRPDSAERQNERGSEFLDDLTRGQGTFWCHHGMAYIVRWRHPSGMVVEAPRDEVGAIDTWAPRIVENVPYKASGRPADQCAGWAARTRVPA